MPDPLHLHTVRHAYDALAEDYARHLPDTRAEAPIDLAMIDAFVHAVTAGDEARVLDAGCGAGRLSRHLADRGCRVVGVDLSPGMVAAARRAHPDLPFTVGSLTDLPYAGGAFAGVLLWYSIIHTPPAGQEGLLAEVARVMRPGAHLLVGFQAGEGAKDVSAAYARLGHRVALRRHRYGADEVASLLGSVGLREVCRMVRRPQGKESDDQAVILARAERPSERLDEVDVGSALDR